MSSGPRGDDERSQRTYVAVLVEDGDTDQGTLQVEHDALSMAAIGRGKQLRRRKPRRREQDLRNGLVTLREVVELR